METDIKIAQKTKILHITEIAKSMGLEPDDLELYGKYKAKIPLKFIDEKRIKKSKLVLVTAMTPTPAGEGKTTTSIGLAQGLNKIGKKATVVIREPSLGPVFGVKGGAAGGGYAQVIPMEDINLHFTGDIAAVEKANNLLSALIDNNLQSKKGNLGLDPRTIFWKRVIDMNDRSLRNIVIGLGGSADGVPRETGFNIAAASEVMAILCMAQNIEDLKHRLGNIFIGYTWEKQPIFARDLKAEGAMAALLKAAMMPNLVQTLEGTPAIIHGGPFANIAQGTNSIVATKMGMSLSDIVVTEAGFASDLGAEKFFNIKCQQSGLLPSAVVIVATIRALKYHGGVNKDKLKEENVDAVNKGFANLEKHIENMTYYGFTPIIALNKFSEDTEAEITLVQQLCESHGVKMAVNESWEKGGEGAIELAELVLTATDSCTSCFNPLYDLKWDMKTKIETIAKKMYGAKNVQYSVKSQKTLDTIESLGMNGLAICMAKTQNSLSEDPSLRGRPRDFTIKIRDIEIASGAGFIVSIAGSIMRMPGLPATPSAEFIDIDNDGNISALF